MYSSWAHMKTRCDNSNIPDFRLWGGRGITYIPEWKSFKNFSKDMAGTYKKGLQLDRIDNDKGYSKENCRWVDQIVQNNNRRDNIYLQYNGERKTLAEWSRIIGMKISTLNQRFFVYHWAPDKCLITPVKERRQLG